MSEKLEFKEMMLKKDKTHEDDKFNVQQKFTLIARNAREN
jgi:hypothetical protein